MGCPSCGEAGDAGARFCASCGTPLGAAEPMPGVRKTVTVLFCDLVDSTALSERLDPERLRGVMLRYYDLMAERLLRHGGVVEKFIGDAVVAIFGVPAVREDDPLRAVRAALAMHEAMEQLNREVATGIGAPVAIRVAVNTGDVLTSGEAVNVAARLQQHAGPGDVVIGPETQRLVAPFAELRPIGPLRVKGKSEPVPAWLVTAVDPDASGVARRFSGPFVGRQDELARLDLVMRQVTRDGSPHLVTVLADAGVGKSRLAREFLAITQGQGVLVGVGRCRPDGAAGTLHAVAEAVTELLAQAGPVSASEGAAEAAEAVDALRHHVLRDGALGNPPDTHWALTRLLEHLSGQRPVILVVDDLHWAKPALLDALDHLAEWVHGPVLLCGLSRLDLLEHRPQWGSLRPNAMSFTLSPLTDDEAELMLTGMADVVPHALDVHQRIARRAEGNPLFLEHLAEMMTETGADGALPRSIQLLLAARLDRLPPGERQTLECATIAGREFTAGMLADVCPDPDHATTLRALHRKRLVTPVPGGGRERCFRFASGLVQEIAYGSMPKRLRAEMHERYARCLARDADVGEHLERAYRLRVELGHVDEQCRRVRDAAASHLYRAGTEALARSDLPWADTLLQRAVDLLDGAGPSPGDGAPSRLAVAAQLADVRIAMGGGRAGPEQLRQLMAEATAAGQHRIAAHLHLTLAYLDPHGKPFEDSARAARAALPIFQAAGDQLGLARAWLRIGQERQAHGQYAVAARILEQALTHAERAGADLDLASLLGALTVSLWLGPQPATAAIERCRDQLSRHGAGPPAITAAISCPLAGLLAAGREFAEARTLLAQARRIAAQIGHAYADAAMVVFNADLEVQAGRLEVAEELLRAAVAATDQLGDRQLSIAATSALARVLLERGRTDAARECLTGYDLDQSDLPPTTLAQRCGISARILAHEGEAGQARLLADLAVTVTQRTDSPVQQARALMDRAWVAHLLGDEAGRTAATSAARDRLTDKGDLAGLARVDAWLATGGPRP
jgi:class 3 adenylate cyclase/tetratricopeptide (TPR) repeat protein